MRILIETARGFEKSPFYDIVYEWEDVLTEKLGDARLSYRSKFENDLLRATQKIGFLNIAPCHPTGSSDVRIRFDMLPRQNNDFRNHYNTVPWLIDFFLDEGDYDRFYRAYKGYPLVLVSSMEVYDLLKKSGCPLNIRHLALSLPDNYRFDPKVFEEKRYDIVLAGRPNPALASFLEQYLKKHPETTVISRKIRGNNFDYLDLKGNIVSRSDAPSRQEYFRILKMAKVAFYGTPGRNAKEKAGKFNQVTPRFLEMLSAGCIPILQYTDNPDTRYYELGSWCPSIESYDQFETEMNHALSATPNSEKFAAYLRKHYTSVRANELSNIIKELK